MTVAIIAVIVRFTMYLDWQGTALGALHLVPGTQMSLQIHEAVKVIQGNFAGFLTPYSGLIALYGSAAGVILFQLLSGVAVALMTAWCALHIYGKRIYGAAAGIIAGLFGPALMYELLTVPESLTVFLSIASFCAMLLARKRGFAGKYTLLFGVALGLVSCCNIAGFLQSAVLLTWTVLYQYRRKRLAPWFIITGIALVWLVFALVNWNLSGRFLPFRFAVRPGFIVELGKVFLSHEYTMPGAIGFYFLAGTVKVLRHLISPVLLYPAAVCGFIFLLWGRRIFRKDGLILLYVIPVTMGVALAGAYCRILLYPALAVCACYSFYWGAGDKSRRIIAIALLIAATQFFNKVSPVIPPKPADYATWGQALLKKKSYEEAQKYLNAAYKQQPENAEFLTLAITPLINRQRYADAAELLRLYPADDSYFFYFTGRLELGSARPDEALKLFAKVKPAELHELAKEFEFYRNEAVKLQRK